MSKRLFVALFAFCLALSAFAADNLTITKVGPVGEVANLAEANEVRVTFSEPMVTLGKIPNPVTAPFFHITPSVPGSFRWAGTTTLIFTPEPQHPLPFATTFTVAIDPPVKSVAGHPLDKPYTFSFSTPTIRLTSANSYRKGGRFDGAVVVLLRFNQPVSGAVIAEHLQLRFKPHDFQPPAFPEEGLARLKKSEPQAVAAFEAKVARATAAANASGTVLGFITNEWDKERWTPTPDLVVFETRPGIPPDSLIEVSLDDQLAAPSKVRSSTRQSYDVGTEPTLFANAPSCTAECNPESYNPVSFRAQKGIKATEVRRALTVWDITNPAKEVKLKPSLKQGDEENDRDWSSQYGLDELGYTVEPAHSYLLRVDPSLTANDGQTLGYTWMAVIANWHNGAFISFGDGHGVWETGGGPQLPFSARNYQSVTQWVAPLKPDELLPTTLKLENDSFGGAPPTPGRARKLAPVPDKIQSYGLDISSALNSGGFGLAWAAAMPGTPLPMTKEYDHRVRSTIVQVTNLGLSVKDSPLNTLVFVTRLDNAAPVAGATVSIRAGDNSIFWTGKTDARGIALAPNTDLRRKKKAPPAADAQAAPAAGDEEESEDELYGWEALGQIHFIVTAEKDGDVAYVVSNWNEGIGPWDLGVAFDLSEALALIRGTVFSDRGVYKPGEEVHVKAVLRSDTAGGGMKLLPAGTKVVLSIWDTHEKEVDRQTLALNEWSSTEAVFKVPAAGVLGNYQMRATIEGQRGEVSGNFLVAAYRRPDFRVDTTLTPSPADAPPVAGVKLSASITGRYLFGGAMGGRAVKWSYSKTRSNQVPQKILDTYEPERYTFIGWDPEEEDQQTGSIPISSKETKLNARGELKLTLDTELEAGKPYDYTIEGVVTDVSRQRIAGRATLHVNPAPWYLGVKSPPYLAEAAKGLDTDVVAAALDGTAAAGVKIHVELKRIQWTSVRKAEGNGFYTWESTRKLVDAGSWDITTQASPVPIHAALPEGGAYQLTASAMDEAGHSTKTFVSFYALGAGYTAWARSDNNILELVPERAKYKPGETARIMIKSPWEHATGLLTTEREGVRTSKQFELTSTQQTISVPIAETDIPNVFVSVLLVKGRTKEAVTDDASDPGKPAFRLGYVALDVEDATKRLKVSVKANRDEYRPATKARIDVEVKDGQGKPARSELTLWAVDYGVLSLTGYQTPDIIDSVYLRKALQVVNEDSRQKIISRRVLIPKGGSEGGGGGADRGPGTLRKDFRVLAFWLGSIVTDKNGRAKTEVTLPESLTTYRIMAVASDKASRFGWSNTEIRVNKPVLLTATFPRFLAMGDKAFFGAVVHSQLAKSGTATVTVKSLDPDILAIDGPATATTPVAEKGSAEVRFNAIAKAPGNARIQMSVQMERESDAFEDVIPVLVPVTPESVVAYGEAKPDAKETLQLPENVIPGFGGLHLDLASTAMVGLGEGARYLVEYPYGCSEQRSSGALALMLTADLGNAFQLPGIDPAKGHAIAQTTLTELDAFQCGGGGFAYWGSDCVASPYLTSWILHVMQVGKKLGYTTSGDVMQHGYVYLEQELSKDQPPNEGWWPAYTAWQAFAVKVLAEGGRNVDSHVNRIYGYADRMPLFGLAHLADALAAKKDPRLADIHRRISNAILPEAGGARVQELEDRYLLWLWNSNVRSTAIALGTLVRTADDEQTVKLLVRWLMRHREKGRWGNTQENAWAMESLIDYYKKYESEKPDFAATVALGGQPILTGEFRGRTTTSKSSDFSMAQILARGKAGESLPLTFHREGAGALFYTARLKYASATMFHDPLDAGFKVQRKYTLSGGKMEAKSFKAGDLVEVTLTIRTTKERQFVAVSDPIPAGTEPVETWFATTAAELVQQQMANDTGSWADWWRRGGWDHIERRDDRVNVFATRLAEGTWTYKYLVRATTAGTFTAAPTHVEEMYEPEVFGRTATDVVEVKP
jgi:alpha-2-macroglobulin